MSSTIRFPPAYVFKFLLGNKEIRELEDGLDGFGALRYTIQEAEVGLTRIPTKARVEFELRKLKFMTVDVTNIGGATANSGEVDVEVKEEMGRKRKAESGKRERRSVLNDNGNEVIELSSDEDETESEEEEEEKGGIVRKKLKSADGTSSPAPIGSDYDRNIVKVQDISKFPNYVNVQNTFKVLKIDWYFDSIKEGMLLPIDKYLIYEGRRVTEPPKSLPSDLLTRAAADSGGSPNHKYSTHYRQQQSIKPLTRPTLLTESTSEHDDPSHFPPLPEYLKTIYSCERPTPLTSPNDPFINQLKTIKLKRLLDDDPIGVLAYSTSIASIAAYPYPLRSPNELIRLPGCDQKIANLLHQFLNTGTTDEVLEFERNPRMQVLKTFYNIWGVAEITAREFHDQRNWKDLDDVVVEGWNDLKPVQKVGVKYYEELNSTIPRSEVEAIGSIILSEARRIDPGYQMVIVGGFRRGKLESGDVDIMLTHPDESRTLGFLPELTWRLEEQGWITNILQESMKNSERGQRAVDLGWKKDQARKTGFDSLDKALVVWQDINFQAEEEKEGGERKKRKNPNPHRRVDIIITPWKTAGTAIIGWSGGTTFQRDLRKYCKKKKNWRFDSSGIRERGTGEWVDLERGVQVEGLVNGDIERGGMENGDMEGKMEKDMIEVLRKKEMAVFKGIGLEWREPWERCTG
ncbi:uncharacterized protein EAE98_006551 [Botrytis deweyae]|uniref:DNA polymerase n=1 Tax=Botrytis deweyae TaxID=2478750 RepID=A0ABQ7IJP5_9HELO|nr:uncharacterized protein EAE98_006551 [Botrytis deweyae]KAF7926256.1 hypothetical protein EAE98_006551 [Botrytis deweyae]